MIQFHRLFVALFIILPSICAEYGHLRAQRSPQAVIQRSSVVDTPAGLQSIPPGSKVESPEVAAQTLNEAGILTKPSVVDTGAGLANIPAGSKVVPPAGQRQIRSPQEILTKPSVVDTPAGLASIPAGSKVEPPELAAHKPSEPGIPIKPSVVDTPLGLTSVPGGSKVVPPGLASDASLSSPSSTAKNGLEKQSDSEPVTTKQDQESSNGIHVKDTEDEKLKVKN